MNSTVTYEHGGMGWYQVNTDKNSLSYNRNKLVSAIAGIGQSSETAQSDVFVVFRRAEFPRDIFIIEP